MSGSKVGCLLMIGNAYMATSGAFVRGEKASSRFLASGEPIIPTLGVEWESIPNFPPDETAKRVGEATSALIGDDFIITGGFEIGWTTGLEVTYSLNLKDHYEGNPVEWVENDNNPITPFISHSGHAVGNGLLYHCGGYLGEDPGPHIDDCYAFDKEKEPGTQWTKIASLPSGRGGGGMVYVESLNSLVFSLGAQRPVLGSWNHTVDFDDTWMLDLSDENATWVSMAPIPYKANHVSAVTAKDCYGHPHYFFLGGQHEEREWDMNLDDVYEYFPERDEWEQRTPLPVGTGHATSSTIAYGCGFLVVGGTIDGNNPLKKINTGDILYYDIPTDTWTKIGDYFKKAKALTCAVYLDKLYCATGYRYEAVRTTISYPIELPLIEGSPTSQPTSAPAPLWDDVAVNTKVKEGDFCPDATVLVRLEVAGESVQGETVTLKNEELGIDMSKKTNKFGKAKFLVSITDPSLSGTYQIEGCAYDAVGTAYCDKKRVEISCVVPTMAPSNEPTSTQIDESTTTPPQLPSLPPSSTPSAEPSPSPSGMPSENLSQEPSITPSAAPTEFASDYPSDVPSTKPTPELSATPSQSPSRLPSDDPSSSPSAGPSLSSSDMPSKYISQEPSMTPSAAPTEVTSDSPSQVPSMKPSPVLSATPSKLPSQLPSNDPSRPPSAGPSSPFLSEMPSVYPSRGPSILPSAVLVEEVLAPPAAVVADTSEPTFAPTTLRPLWDDVFIRTKWKDGDFCPDATMLVRLEVAGERLQGAPVTLKCETLGIDLARVTNKRGKAKFAVSITDPNLSGKHRCEGCAYDASGNAYCDKKRVEILC